MFRATVSLASLLMLISTVCLADLSPSLTSADGVDDKPAPRIQVAILLDTSNSMDGLINQARTQLWKIVNELASTKRDGCAPHLEVPLYEYGNDSLSAKSLHIRQAICLTDDLDRVSRHDSGLLRFM